MGRRGGWRLWAEGLGGKGSLRPLGSEPRTRCDAAFRVSPGLSPAAASSSLTPEFQPGLQAPFSPSFWSLSSPLLSLSLFPVPSVCRWLRPGFLPSPAPHRRPLRPRVLPRPQAPRLPCVCVPSLHPLLSGLSGPRPWLPCMFCLSVSTTRSPLSMLRAIHAELPPSLPLHPASSIPEPRFPTYPVVSGPRLPSPRPHQPLSLALGRPSLLVLGRGLQPAASCSALHQACWASPPRPGSAVPKLLSPRCFSPSSPSCLPSSPRRQPGAAGLKERESLVGEGERPLGAPQDKGPLEWGCGRRLGWAPER